MNPEFVRFRKIPRLYRDIIVTEKIDGTNAQILVSDAGDVVSAGSRNQWIYPEKDNFGFAAWVRDNAKELLTLGPGRHFGEWWGAGIQRKYGLQEKRFSLFNVERYAESRPACCGVVPVLYRGPFDDDAIQDCLSKLRARGSVAAPGFMDPEGLVVYHTAGGVYFKVPFDQGPKGRAGAGAESEAEK